MDYQATAIIVKVQRLGDADKILSLYSKEHGLIKAVAKGAFKVSSKFCAKSEVLNSGEFLLAQGRNLDIVKEIKINNSYKNLRRDYLKINCAFFLVDIIEHIAIKDEHYETPYQLLQQGLEELDQNHTNTTEYQAFASTLKFQWQLIDFLGYKPDLNHCSITQIKRSTNQIPEYFDFENGAITSKEGYDSFSAGDPYQDQIKPINKNAFKVLNHLDQKTQEFSFGETELISAIKLLHKHLEYRLHKEIKSWKILESSLAVSSF